MKVKRIKEELKTYKYIDIIIFINITMMAIINIISGKIVQIGVFTLSAASLCIPITYIVGDLLTEVYGYKQARRATWILIFTSILMAALLQLAVILPPSPGFKNNDAYVLVLSQVPRIVIGAWVALFGGQFINDYVLARMKVMTRGKYLWMRTIGSTLTGQAVDTTLFYTIALYNIIPAGLLVNSILSAWILKVIIEIVMTPFTYFVVKKLKKLENEDYYDKKTNFNPFVFQSR
jgi:queuosine precursor transporter